MGYKWECSVHLETDDPFTEDEALDYFIDQMGEVFAGMKATRELRGYGYEIQRV